MWPSGRNVAQPVSDWIRSPHGVPGEGLDSLAPRGTPEQASVGLVSVDSEETLMPQPEVSPQMDPQPKPRRSLAHRAKRALLDPPPPATLPQHIARIVLGAFLLFAGIAHLTFARQTFQAQVPDWVPVDQDFVVVASGVVEVTLGGALLALGRFRIPIGWATAAFFVAIFPGNISQFVTGTDAFGLESDTARGLRLLFQPVLVLWALWSCGAFRAFRD